MGDVPGWEWMQEVRCVPGQDERPDPAQAKSNTSGKARTTVQAQTAYTIK
jgi:hypothetical protein